MSQTPWETLGLPPGADAASVKAAYFALIRDHPPDRDPERFKEIREAYEQLRSLSRTASGSLRSIERTAEHLPRPEVLLRAERERLDAPSVEEIIRLTI